MRHRRGVGAVAICLFGSLAAMQVHGSSEPISVEDLARFAIIGDPRTVQWNDDAAALEPGVFSPDGKQVAVVVRQGDPDQGTNDGTVLVYRTADLQRKAPRSRTVAQFRSRTNFQPVSSLRWLNGDDSVAFVGTSGDEFSQVYRADVANSRLTQLTNLKNQLLWFDITPSGETIVTLASRDKRPPASDPECRRRGCLVTADMLWDARDGLGEGSTELTVHRVPASESKVIASPESVLEDVKRCDDQLAGGISLDGRFAIRMCEPGNWPRWWDDYTADPTMMSCAEQRNIFCLKLPVLINLTTGGTSILGDAPFRPTQPEPMWIDDGRLLVFPATFEPLVGVDAKERSLRAAAFSVLQFDTRTQQLERILRLDPRVAFVTSATWDKGTQTLTMEAQSADRMPLPTIRLRRSGEQWHTIQDTGTRAISRPATRLAVEQSLNDPPRLVAVDRVTGGKNEVLDPNPWLSQRQLGKVEVVEWNAKDGRSWRGGLYYPPGYSSGARYPVVIQTHGFIEDQFSLSGRARNFAGRALTAQGIFVLQVHENDWGVLDTPEEWPAVQAGYEGAVDHLVESGLIDSNRVGIQGWSRTGSQMGFTLTHSAYRFAAGAFTDTADLGWWFYLAMGAPKWFDQFYAAEPFGLGRQAWLKQAPSFNLDRIRTPMLMCQTRGLEGLWDWYAGLKRLGKPVEYWYLPDGEHDAFQVPQRLHMNHLLVDWFRFWLKDEADGDPGKSVQYERWRKLREGASAEGSTAPDTVPSSR